MHWPYTLDFADSFLAAQWGAAWLLTAALFFWPVPRAARWLLLGGAWLAAVAIVVPEDLANLSFHHGPQALKHILLGTSLAGVAAAVVARRPIVTIVAALGVYPLWWLTKTLTGSDAELTSLHLAWLGLIGGLLGRAFPPRTEEPPEPSSEGSYLLHDAIVFFGTTLLAGFCCVFVLHKHEGGADEWGYTYQAAVFAKGRLYDSAPACQTYLENFYVYESSGRMFSQYTPGWPMFIVPFVWIRQVWLSGPFSLGLMAWGMARLGRSAMRAFGRHDAPPSARTIRYAGTWAALLSGVATSLVTNGASRYPHVYTLALYAWMLEGLMQVTAPGLDRRRQWLWGAVLGTAAMHGIMARPADGAFMGIGVALVFVAAMIRRQVAWRGFAGAAATFAFWGAFMLVVLRLQIGKWFTTGYALNAVIHPWNVVKFSKPGLGEWKYGLPLATGAYCWWPASMPLGLAGLTRLRGRARALTFAMAVSCIPYVVFCMYLDLGQRGFDWGYGPRYLMVLVVPMAIGGGVALGPLTRAALSRTTSEASALRRGGPLAIVLLAVLSSWIRIVPYEWATLADHTRKHSAVNRAIDDADIHHAIVLVSNGTTEFSDIDLTTNYPVHLYPDQDVLIALERNQPKEAVDCLRGSYPGRALYKASGRDDVRLTPMP